VIGLCTDSNAQLPAELVERFAVEVVPLTITIDGQDFLEGVDLDADTFYEHHRNGRPACVRSAAPSPGQFAAAYDDLVARGCTEILSVHLSAAVPATINAARIASRAVDVPIRVVDSGAAGFGIACCVWAAHQAIADGATLDEAAAVAEGLRSAIGSMFVVGSPAGLRLPGCKTGMEIPGGTAVLSFRGNEVDLLEHVESPFDAVNSMATRAIRWSDRVKVAVGHSCGASSAMADALEAAVGEAASVVDVVRYRIGPSVGAHTGPGTVSCISFPAD
jgi:DegV family protein with EDD domain